MRPKSHIFTVISREFAPNQATHEVSLLVLVHILYYKKLDHV